MNSTPVITPTAVTVQENGDKVEEYQWKIQFTSVTGYRDYLTLGAPDFDSGTLSHPSWRTGFAGSYRYSAGLQLLLPYPAPGPNDYEFNWSLETAVAVMEGTITPILLESTEWSNDKRLEIRAKASLVNRIGWLEIKIKIVGKRLSPRSDWNHRTPLHNLISAVFNTPSSPISK